MNKTNYSYQTSLPAYQENQDGKKAQKEHILNLIQKMGGFACLKQIEQILHLPQSTVAGRINDLVKDARIKHDGFMEYEARKRKKFVIINDPAPVISIQPGPDGQYPLFGT